MILERKKYNSINKVTGDTTERVYFPVKKLNATGYGMALGDCIHCVITQDPWVSEPKGNKTWSSVRLNVRMVEQLVEMKEKYQESLLYIDLELSEYFVNEIKKQPLSYWTGREVKISLEEGKDAKLYWRFQSIASGTKVNSVLPLPGIFVAQDPKNWDEYDKEVIDKFVAMGSDFVQAFSQTTLIDGLACHTAFKVYLDENFKAVQIRKQYTQVQADQLFDAVLKRRNE